MAYDTCCDERCLKCHGGKDTEAGLDLSDRDPLLIGLVLVDPEDDGARWRQGGRTTIRVRTGCAIPVSARSRSAGLTARTSRSGTSAKAASAETLPEVLGNGAMHWLAVACGVQYAGLLAERWFFFAQARHPQNLYYQAIS